MTRAVQTAFSARPRYSRCRWREPMTTRAPPAVPCFLRIPAVETPRAFRRATPAIEHYPEKWEPVLEMIMLEPSPLSVFDGSRLNRGRETSRRRGSAIRASAQGGEVSAVQAKLSSEARIVPALMRRSVACRRGALRRACAPARRRDRSVTLHIHGFESGAPPGPHPADDAAPWRAIGPGAHTPGRCATR